MPDRVYKKIEITGTSTTSLEEAVENAIDRAAKTVRKMRWFEVVETRGRIDDGKVAEWQVTVKIGFALERLSERQMSEPPPIPFYVHACDCCDRRLAGQLDQRLGDPSHLQLVDLQVAVRAVGAGFPARVSVRPQAPRGRPADRSK